MRSMADVHQNQATPASRISLEGAEPQAQKDNAMAQSAPELNDIVNKSTERAAAATQAVQTTPDGANASSSGKSQASEALVTSDPNAKVDPAHKAQGEAQHDHGANTASRHSNPDKKRDDVRNQDGESSSCTNTESQTPHSLAEALKAAEDSVLTLLYDLKSHTPESSHNEPARKVLDTATTGLAKVMQSIQAAQKASKAVPTKRTAAAPLGAARDVALPLREKRQARQSMRERKAAPAPRQAPAPAPSAPCTQPRSLPPHTKAAPSAPTSKEGTSAHSLSQIPEQQPRFFGPSQQEAATMRLQQGKAFHEWAQHATAARPGTGTQCFVSEELNLPGGGCGPANIPSAYQGYLARLPVEWELLKHRALRNAPYAGGQINLTLQGGPTLAWPPPSEGAFRYAPPPRMLRATRNWGDDSEVIALGPSVLKREWSTSELREHRL